MTSEFIVYHNILKGWISGTGNTTSSWTVAKVYSREEAITICRNYVDHQGLVCFPVDRTIIEEVTADDQR